MGNFFSWNLSHEIFINTKVNNSIAVLIRRMQTKKLADQKLHWKNYLIGCSEANI